jgi:hypothetical protein
MDIPIWLLNWTDWITHESQKVDDQAVNSQPVVREALEQIESTHSSQNVCCMTSRAENSEPTAFLGRSKRFETMSKGIAGLFMSC